MAERATTMTLADMDTASGLQAGQRDNPAEAALWFAAAAKLAGNDAHRVLANRTRFSMWIAQIPTPVRTMGRAGESPREVVFHPSRPYLMVITKLGKCTIWDIESESVLDLPSNEQPWIAAAWNAAGDRLALGDSCGNARVVSFPDMTQILKIHGAQGAIQVLSFSPDGRRLAIAGKVVRVWEFAKNDYFVEWEHPAPVARLAFSPSGELLVTACTDGLARVYSLRPAEAKREPLFAPVANVGPFGRKSWPLRPVFVDSERGLLTQPSSNRIDWLNSLNGQRVRSLVSDWKLVDGASASRDGRLVVIHGFAQAQVFSAIDGAPEVTY